MSIDRSILRPYLRAHFGKNLMWTGAEAFSLLIMIRHLGLSPDLAGALFLAGALCNALADTLVGYLRRARGAAGRVLDHAVLALCALSFAALPLVPDRMPAAAFFAIIAFRVAFAWLDVPHNALTSRIGIAPESTLELSRVRTVWSSAASLLLGLMAIPLLGTEALSPPLLASGFAILAAIGWVLMLPLPDLLARIEPPTNGTPPRMPLSTLPRHFRQSGMAPLFLASGLGVISFGALSKALLHVDLAAYAWGSAVFFLLTIGRLAVGGGWNRIAHFLGHEAALSRAYLATAMIVALLPWALAFEPLAITTVILAGGGIGAMGVMTWYELTRGVQRLVSAQSQEGLFFGLFTTWTKVALGLGGMAAGVWIGAARDGTLTLPSFTPGCMVAAGLLLVAALLCRPTSRTLAQGVA